MNIREKEKENNPIWQFMIRRIKGCFLSTGLMASFEYMSTLYTRYGIDRCLSDHFQIAL